MWKNRIVPTLLALCMVMALLPATVFAATEPAVECTGAADVADCQAETHKENCPKAACNDDDCQTSDEHTNGSDKHTYACACLTVAGGCKKTEPCSGSCTCATKVTVKGTACADCKGAGGDDNEGGDTPAPVIRCTDCGCVVTANSACKVAGQYGATADSCAHNAETFTGSRPSDCAYTVCRTVNCSKNGKNVKDHSHDDVTTGNCSDGGEFNSKKVNCAGTTHNAGCPKMCGVAGCNKTKGHVTTGEDADAKKHSGSTCTNDAGCPVTADLANIGSHQSTCPVIKDVTASDASHALATYTGEHKFNVTCTCNTSKHDADKNHVTGSPATACGKTVEITVSVSAKFEYELPTKGDMTDAEYAEACKAAETRALAAYDADAANTAAENQWKAENPPESYICDTCAKQNNSAELALCTMAFDCPATKHRDNCLKLCTHDDNCKNAIGNPAAHTVWYDIIDKTVVSPGDPTVSTFETREAAVAARQALIDAARAEVTGGDDSTLAARKDAAAKAAAAKYSIVTNHCERAGVASSVVLGGDDTATDPTEPTTPEVKAPEKAEDFADLDGSEWYAGELTALVEKGIFTGSLDDGKYSFNATGNVTGAELVVLLSRVAGEDLVTTGAEWNKAATAWASEAGYTEGVDITTTGALTRQDVILVLWRAAGSPDSEQSLEDFPDADGLEGDYLTAMKWAVEKKIIKGDGDSGEIKAEASITRAEIVAVLSRYSEVK